MEKKRIIVLCNTNEELQNKIMEVLGQDADAEVLTLQENPPGIRGYFKRQEVKGSEIGELSDEESIIVNTKLYEIKNKHKNYLNRKYKESAKEIFFMSDATIVREFGLILMKQSKLSSFQRKIVTSIIQSSVIIKF